MNFEKKLFRKKIFLKEKTFFRNVFFQKKTLRHDSGRFGFGLGLGGRPFVPLEAGVKSIAPNPPESIRIVPNRPESSRIDPTRPESSRIHPSRPESTQMKSFRLMLGRFGTIRDDSG